MQKLRGKILYAGNVDELSRDEKGSIK